MNKEDYYFNIKQLCEEKLTKLFHQKKFKSLNLPQMLKEVEGSILMKLEKKGYLLVIEYIDSGKKLVYISKYLFALTHIQDVRDIFNWHKFIDIHILHSNRENEEENLFSEFQFYSYPPKIHSFVVFKKKFQVDNRNFACYFTLDVSNTKQIIRELYKNRLQQALFKDAFQRANISIVMTNTAGQITYVNKFFERVTGYTRKEVLGQNPRILQSGETSMVDYIAMWKNLSAGKAWEGVFTNIKKDGTKYYEKVLIQPLFSHSNKNIIHYIAFKILISEDFLSNQEIKTKNLPFEIISRAKLGYLLLDMDGYIIALNKIFLNFFSVGKNAVLFKSISEVVYMEFERLAKIFKITKNIKKFHSIIQIKRRNLYLDVVSQYTRENEILMIFKDVTKLKKTEERVQAKSFKLYEIIDFVKIAIFSINTSGFIINANETALNILELDLGSLKDKYIFDFFKDERIIEFMKKELFNSEIKSLMTDFVSSKNKSYFVEVDTKITYDILKQKIVLLQLRDITQEKREKEYLQRNLAEKTIELSLALKKEKQLNKLKTDFISITSHEFRTPLTTISFTTEFIKKHKDKMTEEQYQAKIQKILSQTKFMEKLLDDMILIGKFNSDKVVVEKKKVSINEFLREMLKEFETIYPDFTFRLVNTAENDLVELDIKIGQSIFQNLISNAVKYSREKKEVVVKLINPDKVSIVIEVKDFGLGIPAEYKNSIFENFVRAPNVAYIQGTGLGLSIVKKSVEAHGGHIFFTSDEGVGTSFFVSLPVVVEN